MTGVAIRAEGLAKRYRLGERGYATVRELLETRLRRRGESAKEEVWALRDIELEIGSGEVVGIVGRNGAGKTTLLKTVARIVRPTTGVVRVRGRVGALLEIGTGFHPELTGRENIFLNGVVLGMSRAEIRRRFDGIVEFAGVEAFLDTPLKRYSSGMNLRLAFAVAAHIEPDVVIVDEVLAVGDAEFQRRCLGRMSEFAQEGRTVLFVSHDSGAVGRLCSRAIWLDEGRVRDDGPTAEVLTRYLSETVPLGMRASAPLPADAPLDEVSLSAVDESGRRREWFRRDEPLVFELRLAPRARIPTLDVAVFVRDAQAVRVLMENASEGGIALESAVGPTEIELLLPPLLAAGDHVAGVWVGTEHETFFEGELIRFRVLPLSHDRDADVRGVIRPPTSWRMTAAQPDETVS